MIGSLFMALLMGKHSLKERDYEYDNRCLMLKSLIQNWNNMRHLIARTIYDNWYISISSRNSCYYRIRVSLWGGAIRAIKSHKQTQRNFKHLIRLDTMKVISSMWRIFWFTLKTLLSVHCSKACTSIFVSRKILQANHKKIYLAVCIIQGGIC